MSAAGPDQPALQEQTAPPQAAPEEFGWRMPGGEDLLRFALSAGLAAGAIWLETRQESAAPGPDDACPAHPVAGGEQ